jgi:hypothetical protein
MTKSILPFTEVDDKIIEKARAKRESIAERYPMTFALVGTFGLVSTFYGFEKMIDRVHLFVHHPWILLILGIGTLSVTGLALRKLS